MLLKVIRRLSAPLLTFSALTMPYGVVSAAGPAPASGSSTPPALPTSCPATT